MSPQIDERHLPFRERPQRKPANKSKQQTTKSLRDGGVSRERGGVASESPQRENVLEIAVADHAVLVEDTCSASHAQCSKMKGCACVRMCACVYAYECVCVCVCVYGRRAAERHTADGLLVPVAICELPLQQQVHTLPDHILLGVLCLNPKQTKMANVSRHQQHSSARAHTHTHTHTHTTHHTHHTHKHTYTHMNWTRSAHHTSTTHLEKRKHCPCGVDHL